MFYKHYEKENMFFCYSMTLFHYLKANGFYYLFKDRNPSSDKFYWVFERTPEFRQAIKVYMENKSK